MRLGSTGSRRLVLLAPAGSEVPSSFPNIETNYELHESLVCAMQRLRGKVYLEDGAIAPYELDEGRHRLRIDDDSWHLLILEDEDVHGCIRLREHSFDRSPRELAVSHSALARSFEWARPLENAVERELAAARRMGYRVVEAGGLALDQIIRGSTEALRLALGMFALCEQIGGAVCVSTATQRHCSASILRRIGGKPLESEGLELPPYYDPQYDCQMEVMRFYSWAPNPRYRVWVDEIRRELRDLCVLARPSGMFSAGLAYAASEGLR